MDPVAIIKEYYRPGSRAYSLLIRHGEQVAEKALAAARNVGRGQADLRFVQEAAMLHDIGIFMTDTPSLGCFGSHPYVCHGVLGRELLESIGLPRPALVCERHVGVGIEVSDIRSQALPLPLRDMRPETLEEVLVCYADKFFSKNGDGLEKTPEQVLSTLAGFGAEKAARFREWHRRFTAPAG